MKKETIVKLLIAIIAIICIAWLGQVISNMIVVTLAMTASVLGLIIALLLRYGIPIATIILVLYYLFIAIQQIIANSRRNGTSLHSPAE